MSLPKTAVAAVAFAAATLLPAQQPQQPAQTKINPNNIQTRGLEPYIIKREALLWVSLHRQDADTIRALLSPTFTASGDGQTVTRAEVLSNVSTCKLGAFNLKDFHFRQPNPDTAVLDYNLTRDLTCDGNHLSGAAHASTTWKRQHGPSAYAGQPTWLAQSHTEKPTR